MKIGIDIDDTLTDTSSVVKEYVVKYAKAYSGIDNNLEDEVDNIVRGFLDKENSKKFFEDKCEEMAKKATIKENAKEIIDKLIEEGNEIYIITARSNHFFKNAEEFCANYLKENHINYHKLITSQTYKVQTCINEKIDLMIDDAVDTCENLRKNGIKSILFNSQLNINKNTDCIRVNNWLELYNEIQKM